MGSVRKILYKSILPEREKHHGRMFIDLCENIHIHHREFRTVFSLNEYFEYANILLKSTEDLKYYLAQNQEYKEGEYHNTVLIAGGKQRQFAFLQESPSPHHSRYFPNDFAIELQDEHITDEIHIHYRDFRIAMNREQFKKMATGFQDALNTLNEYEKDVVIQRKEHTDRIIPSSTARNPQKVETKIMGVQSVSLSNIRSHRYTDIIRDWNLSLSSRTLINQLKTHLNGGGSYLPILLSTEKDGSHMIVDGHHRIYAAKENGMTYIDAIILPLTREQTDKIREVETILKEFDLETNNQYRMGDFLSAFAAHHLNRYYSHAYRRLKFRDNRIFHFLRKIKHSYSFLFLTYIIHRCLRSIKNGYRLYCTYCRR